MRKFALPAFVLMSLSFTNIHHSFFFIHSNTDSSIHHQLDGKISEWNTSKFEEDKETGIKYAIDNDSTNLYVALMIPSVRTQFKMMGQGMELFVDVKGKKKESKGIAFPVKKMEANFGSFAVNRNDDNQNEKPDMTAMRSMMATNLISLRLIGFDDDTRDQELMQEGSANIQFSWDDANVMYIEYRIPLSLFSDNSLNQKLISLGWKINGVDIANNTVTSTTTTVERRPAGYSRNMPQQNNFNSQSNSSVNDRMKEQSFWAKYTVVNK